VCGLTLFGGSTTFDVVFVGAWFSLEQLAKTITTKQ
jgi:hypothetical protein